MAKPKIVNQKAKWRAHSIRLVRYAERVQSVYDTLSREVARLALKTGYDGDKPFKWSDYPATKEKFDKIRIQFVKGLREVIYSGTSEEWKQSNLIQDLLADKALKFYGIKRNGKKAKVYYQTNNDALKVFQERKDKGMNLSQKLWNQSASYKTEMEYCLSSAIEKGMSAVKLSKKLSKYLLDYPLLKKDYKEKYGKAIRCQDCEYRSIRLARSEINMAYRSAEQERWKQFDFVLGYEVKLTQNGRHIPDICDELVGKYPKDFKFVGWHPNCLCYTVPVLKTEEQFFNYEEVPEITEPPQGFSDWLKDNAKRIDKAAERGTLPYFVKDNHLYMFKQHHFVLTEKDAQVLRQSNFNAIDVMKYNSSSVKGFDIIALNSDLEKEFDKAKIEIKSKRLYIFPNGNASLSYEGKNDKQEEFYMKRSFRKEGDGPVYVYHDSLLIPKSLQGKGLGKEIFKSLYRQYKRANVQYVALKANLDVGGYAWARYGFSANVEDVLQAIQPNKNALRIFRAWEAVHPQEKLFPMNLIAREKFGKEVLLGSHWNGILDMQNENVIKYFERFIGITD